jgi:hypothetical protein
MPLRNEFKGWANPAGSAMPLENEEISSSQYLADALKPIRD